MNPWMRSHLHGYGLQDSDGYPAEAIDRVEIAEDPFSSAPDRPEFTSAPAACLAAFMSPRAAIPSCSAESSLDPAPAVGGAA